MTCTGDCLYCKRMACFVCGTDFVFNQCTHRVLERHPAELLGPALNPGRKDDGGKTRYDLLPWRGLILVSMVMTHGAAKYAPDNWRKVEGWRWRYFRAAVGHLIAWWGGEKLDPEWGLPHLAHAACCVLFLLELDQTQEKPDIREPPGFDSTGKAY